MAFLTPFVHCNVSRLLPTITAVDSGYDGPRLEDSGEVTMEFCEAMMARFQDSKLIHKK